MFLSKLKAFQDVLMCCMAALIMLMFNIDQVLSHFPRIYKSHIALKRQLKKECQWAGSLMFLCLVWHRIFPEAFAPGVAFHIFAIPAYFIVNVQTTPMISCGLWLGEKNRMTKNQLLLHTM